jgi:hypothetical protein
MQGLYAVRKEEIDTIEDKYRDMVNDEDDQPHVDAYFASKCHYFVGTNRRLTRMKIRNKVNFISPKRFLIELDLKPLDRKDEI